MSVSEDKNILRNSLTEGKKNNGNFKPGPTESVHRLLPDGRESVLQRAKKEE